MKVSVGVMWFPRKDETIKESIRTIGKVDVSIYPDCDLTPPIEGFNVVSLGGNVGCFKHYYRALEHLCNTDADIVGVSSDDVVYARNWHNKAIQHLNEGAGFVSCYVPRGLAHRYTWRRGVHELNKGWSASWGGGYLFRKDVALKLLQHPFILNHRDNYKANQQIDHAIPEAIYQMGLKQLYIVPSLMNHIGRNSTIGHSWREIDKGAGW
jgi:hypothetical protein